MNLFYVTRHFDRCRIGTCLHQHLTSESYLSVFVGKFFRLKKLQEIILEYSKSGIYILVDENTHKLCLPDVRGKCRGLENAMVIEVPGSESNKTIASIEKIWLQLVESLGDGRKM